MIILRKRVVKTVVLAGCIKTRITSQVIWISRISMMMETLILISLN